MQAAFNNIDHKALFKLALLAALLALAVFEPAFAADPFDAAEERSNEVLDFMTGGFAATIVAIVIAVAGICMLKGWISAGWAASLAAGAITIGSAAHIAKWLIG